MMADVCLLLEGTYPFVSGGVSSWVHQLLLAHSDLSFHLVCLTPDDRPRVQKFQPPDNVRSVTCIPLQSLPMGQRVPSKQTRVAVGALLEIVDRLLRGVATVDDLTSFAKQAAGLGGLAGRTLLLDSRMAFETVKAGYDQIGSDSSFLDFFWSWRSLASAVLAVLLPPLPDARCYHAVSTGFAGLLGARLAAATGRPLILTEHGIYTNERRIEIAMADWLYQGPEMSFAPRKVSRDLRDLWIEAFEGFARLTYAAADPVVTLYRGNQRLQLRDGATPARLSIIPNGVDFERYAAVVRDPAPRAPTVALIGRVVPIKDVKTFIRAVGLLRRSIPDARGEILGPLEEDPAYARECAALIRQLGLDDAITLHGPVTVLDWLARIDVSVLTSISEAQPLTILEAGAAGIPCIATDVGACREMIEADPPDEEPLASGGAVTPIANPAATANAMAALLADQRRWTSASRGMQERVRTRFLKSDCDRAYARLYGRAIERRLSA